MSVPVLLPAFSTGEVSPSLFGRYDTTRLHTAAATFRNGFVSYRGGFYSRAGTLFVGFSKQTGRQFPPRLITFQFSINQGLALEFGNFYMRVISNGGFVTESPFAITGVSQSNPAVVSYKALSTGLSAAAFNNSVGASYNRGDTITLAGGAFVTAAVLLVNNTTLAAVTLGSGGTGYAVGDRINLTGGTSQQQPVLTVLTLSGSAIATFAISNGGTFTANGSGNFTQASTTGSGTGATFTGGLFGPNLLTFQNVGSYTAVPPNQVNQASTSGTGAGATYTLTWATPAALNPGDWVAIAGVGGMTELNGNDYVISSVTPSTFVISDVYGNLINSTTFPAFTAGGTAARIYTLATIYSEQDLEWLKFTQSADVMSICCVNQLTNTEYPPQDLNRISDDDWTFTAVIPTQTIAPPSGTPTVAVTGGTGTNVDYQYTVTSVSPVDGTESIASAIGSDNGVGDISSSAGQAQITWNAVATVQIYNIYKATPGYGVAPPVGSLFGFAGQAYGTSFLDSNIIADFTQVPPTHQDPFARGQIVDVNITAGGSSATFTYTINSITGSGAVLELVVVSNVLVTVIVLDPGNGYLPTDTITFSNGATGTLVVGAQSGTYPSVPFYFQERRGYASTLNNPDTYWMSQPGSFTNFDSRNPTIDSDAITGTPWAVEVNGIQFALPMPGGLMVLTGLSAWLLNGSGGSALAQQPITPSSQNAQPQAYNGCSPTVGPIKIDYDVIYLQSKGSIYRRFNFNLYANIYTGEDITINSGQLFTGYTIREHAWCEEPYKLLWAVRNDGALLSATINKPQEVLGWARHDTQGLFESICSVTEPPVDALYLAAQRFPGTNTCYMIERMDNRIWSTVENCWCVDCGIALPQPTPAATLTASSATGLGAITGVINLVGGSGWSAAAFATVADAPTKFGGPMGPGSGAVPTLTIVGGVITAVTFSAGNQGTGYVNPVITFQDPAGSAGGSGASATAVVNNSATFTASANVFSAGSIGSVIRVGGGIATVTADLSPTQVVANITSPIVQTLPDGTTTSVLTAAAGAWSLTAPVTTLGGLGYLAGASVVGVADGLVIGPTVVPASGSITLTVPVTSAVIGLGFTAQLQSVYLDAGEPTVQGQRAKISAATLRVESSLGLQAGSNQIDGSTLSPMQLAVNWPVAAGGMTTVPDRGVAPFGSSVVPLYTGDVRVAVAGGINTRKQVAVQQVNPYPMQILALVAEILPGDEVQNKTPTRADKQQRAP